jgi:hypothetical protein
MTKKNSEGLRILMADGVSQPHTEATPGEILRFTQDDKRLAQDDRMADGISQPGTGATAGEILRCAQDDKRSTQDDTMADGVTQPGSGATEAADETTNRVDEEERAKTPQQLATSSDSFTTPSTVIWTPRFMVIFALTLTMGLSAESVLTQGWTSHYYAGQWVLMGHVAVIFACFIAIMIVTRSWWLRVGTIFGCIWAIFTGINLVVSFYQLDPGSPIPAYLNAIISCALLGAYICLSTERTPFTAWDSWFFRFALIIGAGSVLLSYFIKPLVERSVSIIESAAAAIAVIFCVLVWWLRPSCWKTQPGPTFLFGVMPAFILLLSIPSLGRGATNLYLSQVALLAVILGSMRILQGELRRR